MSHSKGSTTQYTKWKQEICEKFVIYRSHIESNAAMRYWSQVMDTCENCTCEFNQDSGENGRFRQHFNAKQIWNNLKSYRQAKSGNAITEHILAILSGLNIPIERRARTSQSYLYNGVRMCFHSLLGILGIPLGTAQNALCVCCFILINFMHFDFQRFATTNTIFNSSGRFCTTNIWKAYSCKD